MEFSISIVIPTFRRPQSLSQCLGSLLCQDLPLSQMEVIVVDDAGMAQAKQVVDAAAQQGLTVRYIPQHQCGPAAARNKGVRYSRSSIIGFVDDDCVVAADWARKMVEVHRAFPEAAAVGGETGIDSSRITVEISQYLANGAIQTVLDGKPQVIFFPTCNVSLKKEVFSRHRFDEAFPYPGGEDLEFFWRLFKDGSRFIWNRSIRVTHNRRDTVHSFIHQAYVYGRGNYLVQHLHKDQPLLHELKLGPARFWAAMLVNALKIPRFSWIMGRRLISDRGIRGILRRSEVFMLFAVHKVFYIIGNIAEYFCIASGKRQAVGKSNAPQLLILDITHRCNLECRMCDIWKTGASERDVPLRLVKKLLREAKAAGVREITLSGGEPLMRTDLFEILDYSRSLGIKYLGLLSNGLMVQEHFSRLAPYLRQGYVSLVVSLDSLDAGRHNAIRNSPQAHARTVSSLAMLSRFKKLHPAASFNVITIIFDKNLDELDRIAGFVYSLGADFLQFQGLLANNLEMAKRTTSPLWVPPQRFAVLDDAIDSLVRFSGRHPGFIKNSDRNLLMLKEYFRGSIRQGEVRCANASSTLLVSNSGTYTTCFSKYGTAKDTPLERVLSGKEIQAAAGKVQECAWPCLLPCFCDYYDERKTV